MLMLWACGMQAKGVFTLIHLNVHRTKSHQTALNQFAFAPFTLWLLKANSIMYYDTIFIRIDARAFIFYK